MHPLGTTKIIYDFGTNNGDDLPYYLEKGTKVVGVEANRSLCDLVKSKHPSQIQTGQLVIENCALSADQDEGDVDFYMHTRNHVLSRIAFEASGGVAYRFGRHRMLQ